MKGQNEILIFVLLFIIGIALFISATIWSKSIFQQNVDVARMENAEKFMRELNDNIMTVIRFGGSQEMEYKLDGAIELVDNKTIEVKIPVTIPLSKQWVNISSDTSFIQEKLEGDNLRIQIVYNQTDYKVEFFTEGPRLAIPSYVNIERNQTSDLTVIKIKITFS
jgi:hypothetical protein